MSKKLKDNSGASLAVALLFFIMMAVIGSTILAAAASSMGRVKDQDQGNQERYALYSAANLLTSKIAEASVFINNNNDTDTLTIETEPFSYYIDEETDTWYADTDPNLTGLSTNEDQLISWKAPDFDSDTADDLKSIIQEMAKKIIKEYWQGSSTDLSKPSGTIVSSWEAGVTNTWSQFVNNDTYKQQFTFTISPDSSWTSNADQYNVTVKLTMHDNLDIDAVLQLSNNGTNTYYVNIPFNDSAKLSYSTSNNKSGIYTRYNYSDGSDSGWLPENNNLPDEVLNGEKNIETIQLRSHVENEIRTIKFDDFNWQPLNQTTITTLTELSGNDGDNS